MQRKKNDVKARTTLLRSLPDEHQLSLAPEWLMHTIVWRNRNDLETMRLLKASKNLDHLIESQRFDQVKEGVGYNVVPPPAADVYVSPKKDLSWTGLPEFVDDTVTDYSRPSPTIASTSAEGQNKDASTSEVVTSQNPTKPFVKFVKPNDIQPESKSKEQETPKKSQVKYAEQYKHSNKKPKVKGNQRNWNNLKSYQLGLEFVLNKKACYNCGDFSHLVNDCRRRVQRETTRSQNHTYKRPPLRSSGPRPHGGSMRPSYRSAGHRPHGPSMNLRRPNINAEEKTPKALMAIDGVGWDWSYMENEGENHPLVADEEAPTEFALMANTESKVSDNSLCSNECKKNTDSLNSKIKDLKSELSKANNYIYHYKLAVAQLEDKELEELNLEKDGLDGKLAGLLKASKNLDHLIESQRSDQ
nr:hypothetical protein [Tanacetum cinerariifolium]